MRKLILIFCLLCLSFSCSSDDDNSRSQPLQEAHFNLVLNGAGYTNEAIAIDRNTITINNNRIAISAGDEGLVSFFGFYLPFPLETTTYTMVEGSSSNQNTAFYARNQTEFYYTENVTISITEIFEAGVCRIFTGTLNINLSLTSDTSQVLNISGDFELPTETCE